MALSLILEVLDHAPDSLTPKEHLAAIVLAENANERTRQIWDSIEDPKIMARIRVKRARLYELIEGLIEKGVLEQTAVGQKQTRARYRFRALCPAQCPEHPDTETKVSVRESRNLNDVQRPEDPDVSVHGFRTPTPSLLVKTPPPPPAADADTSGTQEAEAGDGYADQTNTDADAVIDKLDLQRQPGRSERAQLLAPIAAALAAGWTVPDLIATLDRDWTGANDRVRTAIYRAKDLGAPRRSSGTANSGLPPWCGQCGGGNPARSNPRFRTLSGNALDTKCPRCHPDEAGRPQPTPSHSGYRPYQNPTDQSVYLEGIS